VSQQFHIDTITALHPGMGVLRAEAADEGFRFVDRLVFDWFSGANRFDRPDEMFIAAFVESRLIGFCGLNRDPYAERYGVGRLRHLYVGHGARRLGVGTRLVQFVLNEAKAKFHVVRLRTQSREAASFYLRLGFEPVQDEMASHIIPLRHLEPMS